MNKEKLSSFFQEGMVSKSENASGPMKQVIPAGVFRIYIDYNNLGEKAGAECAPMT